MATLITVPVCVFHQNTEDNAEEQILICYYKNTISLEQGENSVNINPAKLNDLFKTIKQHLPEAEARLKKS